MAEDEQQGHDGGMPMGSRGVTRPMAEQQMMQHGDEHGGDAHDQGGGGGHKHGPPYSDMRYQMLHMHHTQTLWLYWSHSLPISDAALGTLAAGSDEDMAVAEGTGDGRADSGCGHR